MKYLVGMLVGLYLGYKIWHDVPAPRAPQAVREEAPPLKKPWAIEIRPEKAQRIAPPIAHEKPIAPPIAKVMKQTEGRLITLTTHTIAEMEEHWRELAQDIRLAREDGGWRITELANNSPFAKAGFQKGDLITEKAVASLRETEQGLDDLSERFQKILKSVTN